MPTQLKRAMPREIEAARRDGDLYAWVGEQVGHLRSGRVALLDLDGIAEELGDVGKSEFRDLRSNLAIVILHLLKWDFQPERRSRSWALTIGEHRDRIAETLAESPSLATRLDEALSSGWRSGRNGALDETGLPGDAIPAACPYSLDDILRRPVIFDPAVHRISDRS
jgi:hypothetical protein